MASGPCMQVVVFWRPWRAYPGAHGGSALLHERFSGFRDRRCAAHGDDRHAALAGGSLALRSLLENLRGEEAQCEVQTGNRVPCLRA